MKWEDLKVGQKVWRASIVDGIDGKERLFVTEYEVMMVGKSRFELKGQRSGIRGLHANNRELIADLRPTPAEAVQRRLEVLTAARREEMASHKRQIEHLDEMDALVKDWFNKAGL